MPQGYSKSKHLGDRPRKYKQRRKKHYRPRKHAFDTPVATNRGFMKITPLSDLTMAEIHAYSQQGAVVLHE